MAEIQGYDAMHFLQQAVAMIDERDDEGICPDDAERDRYHLALAQTEAIIGLALAILSKGRE